jgi:hypothetical protein
MFDHLIAAPDGGTNGWRLHRYYGLPPNEGGAGRSNPALRAHRRETPPEKCLRPLGRFKIETNNAAMEITFYALPWAARGMKFKLSALPDEGYVRHIARNSRKY